MIATPSGAFRVQSAHSRQWVGSIKTGLPFAVRVQPCDVR